jgi:plastocyanin
MFPKAGNFKVVCLVHESMTGTIHVLDPSAALPYTQQVYDQQAVAQTQALLSDTDMQDNQGNQGDENEGNAHKGHARDIGAKSPSGHNSVTVGMGEIVATGGGHQTLSIMRFFSEQIVIHVGETVEWTNKDPITPHTITFGKEPDDVTTPSANVKIDADGALHATISSKSDAVNSGLIMAEGHERIAVPTSPLGITRFRITFTKAATYPYICGLHDDLGMKGTIVVLP